MGTTLTAFFTALSEFFKSVTTCKEQQSETVVIKESKNSHKAINYAEKIIFYIEEKFDLSEDKQYQRLRRLFFKYN